MDHSHSVSAQKENGLQLQGIDYIELYVGNALQAAHYYRTAYGFAPIAYMGMETHARDRTSYMLRQADCQIVLTAPLDGHTALAEHVRVHGDGVKDIAFRVENTTEAFRIAIEHGARPVMEPTLMQDEHGSIVKATIAAYGDTVHSFIQRKTYSGVFLPQYQPIADTSSVKTGIQAFDHFAVSVPHGQLRTWVNFYKEVFDFHLIHEEGITTEHSAMRSEAVQDSSERIKFVIVEPVPGKRMSQVEEFLTFFHGAGVQHIALHTDDIARSIQTLQASGVGFVSTPSSYYDMLPNRVGSVQEDIDLLRHLNILVDRDERGYLLQIFAKPLQDRPTLFIEVIQRKNARGFGGGNIKALFQALEREQEKRGNL